jgi:hypothetical protein
VISWGVEWAGGSQSCETTELQVAWNALQLVTPRPRAATRRTWPVTRPLRLTTVVAPRDLCVCTIARGINDFWLTKVKLPQQRQSG